MEYVRRNTSLPIPAIIEVHLDMELEKEPSWVLMERIPGLELGVAWPTMSENARSETIRQLRSFFEQLYQLSPEGTPWIGSCSGGPVYDHRLDNRFIYSPFPTVGDFHDYLVATLKQCPRPEWASKYRDWLPDTHGIRFAHADLSWENILLDPETGNVNGILDWEMAGFWPDWWEYRKALFGSRSQPWWMDVLKEIMTGYPGETEVDMDLEIGGLASPGDLNPFGCLHEPSRSSSSLSAYSSMK